MYHLLESSKGGKTEVAVWRKARKAADLERWDLFQGKACRGHGCFAKGGCGTKGRPTAGSGNWEVILISMEKQDPESQELQRTSAEDIETRGW